MRRQLAGIHLVGRSGQALPAGARRPSVATKAWARLRGRSLDRALSEGADPASSAALARRAVWLTKTRNRRALARSIRRLLEPSNGRRGASAAVPPHRGELAGVRLSLASVAALLETDEPVYSRGLARVQLLLTEGGSPLYFPLRTGDLCREVDAIVDALEGREETW